MKREIDSRMNPIEQPQPTCAPAGHGRPLLPPIPPQPAQRRKSVPKLIRQMGIWGCSLCLLIVGVGCTLGQAESTPVPFAVTPYAAETTPAATAEEAGDVTGESNEPAAAAAENSSSSTTPTGSAQNVDTSTGSAQNVDTSTGSAQNVGTSTGSAQNVGTSTAAEQTTARPAASALLRYNGEIAARDQVVVVAETAGMIMQLPLEVGDRVTMGQTIARIDATLLEAQKAQALAGLDAAQAQLDLLQVAADPADVAAAQAAVAAANAAYQRALAGATAEEQRLALAQLKQAEAAVTVAQAGYNRVKGNPAIGALPESLQLQQATLGLEAAQAQYDKVLKGATDDVIAGAYAQLVQARAALQRLQEGAKDEQIRAAEAQVRQAEMAVYLAQLQVSKATVKAPVAGVVARVNAAQGAMASPGTPLITLLSQAVEVTIAVEEARLAQLQVGQPATIRVDAYPDQTIAGEVAIIAPELNAATRTVQVTIRPTGNADLLVPGMFATVTLALDQ